MPTDCWKKHKRFTNNDAVKHQFSKMNLASQPDLVHGLSTSAEGGYEDAKRCVACPSCLDCADPRNISVLDGFGLLPEAAELLVSNSSDTDDMGSDNDLDIFACMEDSGRRMCVKTCRDEFLLCEDANCTLEREGCLGDCDLDPDTDTNNYACRGFRLRDIEAGGHCGELREGPLCSLCEEGYRKKDGGCELCDQVDPSTWWFVGIVCGLVVVTLVLWKCVCSDAHKMKVALVFLVLQRSWPRIRQSIAILITNFQITGKLSDRVGIDMPHDMQVIFSDTAAFVNLEVLSLPGVACLAGDNYYYRWIVKMLVMPAFGVLVYAIYRFEYYTAMRELSSSADRARRERKLQGKKSQEEYSPLYAAELALDNLSHKLKMTVKIGFLRSRYCDIMFMIVYLLYPGTAATVFQMFHCRGLEGGSSESQLQLLEVAMGNECAGLLSDEAWASPYFKYRVSAWVLVFVYPLGIPAYLGWTLYKNRETIKKNPDYITIGGIKPLFIFYKPDCYYWEVCFMVQKVIFVGFMGLFPPGMIQSVCNVLLSVFMLVVLFKVMPSKTEEYNKANVMSQIVVLLMYMAAQYLQSADSESALSEQTIMAIIGAPTAIFMVYLIYISTVKLCAFAMIQKEDIEKERALDMDEEDRERLLKHSKELKAAADEKDKKLEAAVAKQAEAFLEMKCECVRAVDGLRALELSEDDVRLIAEAIAITTHEAGDLITKKDEEAHTLYWIVTGKALVHTETEPASAKWPPKSPPKQRRQDSTVIEIGPGHYFGERALFGDAAKASAWVQASAPMKVLSLASTDVERVIQMLRSQGEQVSLDDVYVDGVASPRTQRQRESNAVVRRYEAYKKQVATGQSLGGSWSSRMDLDAAAATWQAAHEAMEKEKEDRSAQDKYEELTGLQEAALRRAYNIFDKDGDKSLDEDEVRAHARRLICRLC